MIEARYCCCAVPLVNAGIYLLILEQFFVALMVGILAVALPMALGLSVPSFTVYIFAVICWIVALLQPAGWIGVLREKTTLFKIYSFSNAIAVAAAFSTAAALIITSALRHNTAVSNCRTAYFSSNTASGTYSSAGNATLTAEGSVLCPAFAWADVGIMGGLWLILLIVQSYFLFVTRKYSFSQVSDHKLYHSVYSENPEAFTMSILRSSRYNPGSVYNNMPEPRMHGDEWDARPSMDSIREDHGPGVGAGGYYNHNRGPSDATVKGDERYEDAYNDHGQGYPTQYPQDGYGHPQQGYAEGEQYPFVQPGGGYVEHPVQARQGRDQQTPVLSQYGEGGIGGSNWGSGNEHLNPRRPEGAQSHPAEGMFGRKSPRLVQ